MENTLSEKLKGINGTLAAEVNDACKEYATEKISSGIKKDQISGSIDIANFRSINAVKDYMRDVINTLSKERTNPAFIERLRELINEGI